MGLKSGFLEPEMKILVKWFTKGVFSGEGMRRLEPGEGESYKDEIFIRD